LKDFACAVEQVLVAWFEFLVKNPELAIKADLIVYLKTSPEVSSTFLSFFSNKRDFQSYLLPTA